MTTKLAHAAVSTDEETVKVGATTQVDQIKPEILEAPNSEESLIPPNLQPTFWHKSQQELDNEKLRQLREQFRQVSSEYAALESMWDARENNFKIFNNQQVPTRHQLSCHGSVQEKIDEAEQAISRIKAQSLALRKTIGMKVDEPAMAVIMPQAPKIAADDEDTSGMQLT